MHRTIAGLKNLCQIYIAYIQYLTDRLSLWSESPSLRQLTTHVIDSTAIHNKTNQLCVALRCALRAPCAARFAPYTPFTLQNGERLTTVFARQVVKISLMDIY